MISGAAELGCVAADMPADMRAQAAEFADRLGLAFQIRDDMLDVVGDQQAFGKPIGSDKEEGKITYVDVDGLEGCARAVESCTQKAKDAVAHLSLIHISEPTRLGMISYAVFCLKKKKKDQNLST